MNARTLIASSVLALTIAAPAVAFADTANQQGDGTSHVYSVEIKQDQTTRQAVLNEYKKAAQSGNFSPLAGDASVALSTSPSTTTRAEVLSMIKAIDLTEGDAS